MQKGEQIAELESGADIVVATIGRLMEMVKEEKLSFSNISYLVLDEADRMLSQEFEEELRFIFRALPSKPRQTCMLSATMPLSLQMLARSGVNAPVYITVKDPSLRARKKRKREKGEGRDMWKEEKLAAAHVGEREVLKREDREGEKEEGEDARWQSSQQGVGANVQQDVRFCHTFERERLLVEVLQETPSPPVLVFCNKQSAVDKVVLYLRSKQFHAAALHAGRSQRHREAVLKALKLNKVDVVVATDALSRGVDFPSLSRVVVFDMPTTIEDYIHRVGRVGRAGKGGIATSFLTLHCRIPHQLKKVLEESGSKVPDELKHPRRFGVHVRATPVGDVLIGEV
mmetsp:Transcript_45150/g.116795  ORF Transcript_45150/g.116795 Transcript_45150/m.116795 type:complete len:343 (-) Transcript_45150:199-1227(-)